MSRHTLSSPPAPTATPVGAADGTGPGTPAPGRGVDGPDIEVERHLTARGLTVAGVDEVGRGAWAGALTVGAVVLDLTAVPPGLRDSKRLGPARRETLAAAVHARAAVGIGEVPNEELDAVGLSAALRLAAQRAVRALPVRVDEVLIDGDVDLLADTVWRSTTLVGGDDASASIAAASIVAKVHRDAAMRAADPLHPAYGFVSNKGYPSPAHRAALAEHGPCALHRRSWRPIQRLLTAPQLPLSGSGWPGG